jgi:MarR family 2-MHQ and catechol resistance regulon transcriptional repressor
LLRAGKIIVARLEPRLAAAGLTINQVGVLEAILHRGPLTHGELTRKVLTSAGNLSDVVDKLARRGLVRRSRDAADRRLVRVELTAAGRTLIEGLFPLHAGDIAEAMRGLDGPELRTLSRLLRGLSRVASEPPCMPSAGAPSTAQSFDIERHEEA